MRLMKRNTKKFVYKAHTGEEEVLCDGMHTGIYTPTYTEGVEYTGNISAPSGFVTPDLFGIETNYTHVLLTDKPKADIKEDGLIECEGVTYEIRAVRASLNVMSVALKEVTVNHAQPVTEETDETPVVPETPGEDEENEEEPGDGG